MSANGNARRRTTPANLDAAISAYLSTREGIRAIECKLNVPNMTIYRELDRRGIQERRRPTYERLGDRFCMLDGCDAILSTRQKKYCCLGHANEAHRRFCEETRAERMLRNAARRPRRPFGYRLEKTNDGQRLPDEREQVAIAEMRKRRADGQSLREITVIIRRMGFDISRHTVTAVCKQALTA